MAEPNDTTVNEVVRSLVTHTRPLRPTLLVISSSVQTGKMFLLEKETQVIGRSADSDIWVNDESVSRQHARVEVCGAVVQLVDLASKNGTFCNGERLTGSRVLADGDTLQVGTQTVFKFRFQDSLDEALQKNLYESATQDGLTRLFNKKFFLETLNKEFAYSIRHDLPLSLLMMDVDHFKAVNDTHGHPCGDHVLSRLAAELTDAIRTEDVLARYGGEEFALLLKQCPHALAQGVAERLRGLAQDLDVHFNQKKIKITLSIGVATSIDGGFEDAEGFLRVADHGLYRAKQSGRNRVVAIERKREPTR
ncbi:MAG TPA: GGDEF domain-containing protein [Myxococcaceae bacterium]|nr:GGDEF domain-containing protein [Myxococcaceae bacterium]